jgi:subtilisin family serine protease
VPAPRNISPLRGSVNGLPELGTVAIESASPAHQFSLEDIKNLAVAHPGAYSVNNAGTNIDKLHAMGLTGEGSIVAVIDSGIRPGFKILEDSIIGGIDFVDEGPVGLAGDGPADWRQASNDGHGTFAAGLIVGHSAFAVNRSLETALELYLPSDSLVDGRLPLIGTAPGAKIYVVRIFGNDVSAGAGAPLRRVIEAIRHVIKLRDDFNYGRAGGLKIDVANLSFGFSTLFAGRTELDQLVDSMLSVGIVPVVSAGDFGPSTLTTKNPGTSIKAITVGASSHAASERIIWEVDFLKNPAGYYPGIGADARPSEDTHVAWFSSRGPNADGRLDPDVVASGLGNIGQGYCPDQNLDAPCFKRLTFGSGTSFSAPIVAGIAAVLTQACPHATATQVRNAIIMSARTEALGVKYVADYFDLLDRGRGLPDAQTAYNLLCYHPDQVPDSIPDPPAPSSLVLTNIENDETKLQVEAGSVMKDFADLRPGERAEILYNVPFLTDKVTIRVSDVEMAGHNRVFADRLFLYVHSAKTGRTFGDYLKIQEFFAGAEDFVLEIPNPDSGIMRITLNPDNLNAGNVSAAVSVDTHGGSLPPTLVIDSDTIEHETTKAYPMNDAQAAALFVAPNTQRLDFLLNWVNDWSRYPTSDVDLIVCAPSISTADCPALGNKTGATLAAPERVSIVDPEPGQWKVLVKGFNIPPGNGTSETFDLWIGKN